MTTSTKSWFTWVTSIALAFATGVIFYPFVIQPFLVATKNPEGSANLPKSPYIQKVIQDPKAYKDPERIPATLHLFKFQGCFVDCWVEAEVDGKWQVLAKLPGKPFLEKTNAKPEQTTEATDADHQSLEPWGYVAWRIFQGLEGKKASWDLQLIGTRPDGVSFGLHTKKKNLDLPAEEMKDPSQGDKDGFFVVREMNSIKEPRSLLGDVVILFDGEMVLTDENLKGRPVPVRLKCKATVPARN